MGGEPCATSSAVLASLRRLSTEVAELQGSAASVIQYTDDDAARDVLREHVNSNHPFVLRGGAAHWDAMRMWDREYLIKKGGDAPVTVALTPNGRADAVTEGVRAASDACTSARDGPGEAEGEPCFAEPLERRMPLGEFYALYDGSRRSGDVVPYIQRQNGSLTEEYDPLLGDVPQHIPWATEVFGWEPDAVNLWIGDERSETSFHKDPYENLYAVLQGTKIFTLLPPCSVYRMGLRRFPLARYEDVGGRFVAVLREPREHVLWCPIDPKPDDDVAAKTTHPLFFDATLPRPMRVEVHAGDILFLPSMWYHHVAQDRAGDDAVVAVNYWYDMRFDVRYAYFGMVEALATEIGLIESLECEADSKVEGE